MSIFQVFSDVMHFSYGKLLISKKVLKHTGKMLINNTFPQAIVNITLEIPCEAIKSIQQGWCQKTHSLLYVASKGALIRKNDFSRY